MPIRFRHRGSFKNLERFLSKMQRLDIAAAIEPLAQEGVRALRDATPRESGLAADSWDYKIVGSRYSVAVIWTNSDIEGGFPVAVMLQYGYGTGTGGYVQGRDYINPALRPIFDRIADEVWKVVTAA